MLELVKNNINLGRPLAQMVVWHSLSSFVVWHPVHDACVSTDTSLFYLWLFMNSKKSMLLSLQQEKQPPECTDRADPNGLYPLESCILWKCKLPCLGASKGVVTFCMKDSSPWPLTDTAPLKAFSFLTMILCTCQLTTTASSCRSGVKSSHWMSWVSLVTFSPTSPYYDISIHYRCWSRPWSACAHLSLSSIIFDHELHRLCKFSWTYDII